MPFSESFRYSRVTKKYTTSDGSRISLTEGDVVEIVQDDESSKRDKFFSLDIDAEGLNILDNSAAKHKLSIRPKKNYSDSRQKDVAVKKNSKRYPIKTDEENSRGGWIPADIIEVETSKSENSNSDVFCKREAVVKELLETEEELCRDLVYVVDHYIKSLDNYSVPKLIRDNVDIIFSNFRQISNFHSGTLIEGMKYYSAEPTMLGKTFLRLERDFDKHVAYCRDEPVAQEFLADNLQVKEFFEELSQKLGDEKSISEYLKLPVQRINDYQVLLKDLVRYSDKLGENTHDLKRALELMLAIPQKANDNKFLSNIEGFHGNIHNLGRLLGHDWFSVSSNEELSRERYLFLFKAHILICKVKKISEDRSVFHLKDLISDVKIRDFPDSKSFQIYHKDSETLNSYLKICARKENIKDSWLNEIKKNNNCVFEEIKTEEEVLEKNKNDLDKENARESLTQKSLEETHSDNQTKDLVPKIIHSEKEEGKTIVDTNQAENTETMNRRYSTRRSHKTYEESISISSQREVYVHSSTVESRQSISSSSGYDSRISASKTYTNRSSSLSGSTIRGGSTLAIKTSEKPVFTRTISGLNVEPGETAVFECQLESEAQVTWLKDNKVLEDQLADRVIRSSSDDGTHRLELQHVIESDTGTYTALAQKDDDYSTCTAQLVVEKISEEEKKQGLQEQAPVFIVRLKDTELMENTNFTFLVKVKGTPNPYVKFFKDGVPLISGSDHITINKSKADIGFYELDISDVHANHAGLYSCKATNEFGEAYCEGVLKVTDKKQVFKGLQSDELLTPGEKPSFNWFKNGKSFDPEERFKVLLGNEEDSLALIFQHVKPEDAGLYTCVASTTSGKISCSAELSVQGVVKPMSREPERPRIENEIKSSEASIGGSAMLEAKVLGFPRPDVKWYHEGEEIKAEGRYKFLYDEQETITLVIKNVNPRDGGSYKIVAKNDLGEDCTELSLTVKGAPRIIRRLQDTRVKISEDIQLTVEIEASPVPEVKWYKDGVELKETERIKFLKEEKSGKYSLIIEKAVSTDCGSYSVVASNEVNQCSDFCQVHVSGPPTISKKMEKNVEVAEGEIVEFEIQVSSDLDSTVKWMKDDVELTPEENKIKIIKNEDTYTLRILKANANDSGKYSVEVSNKYGSTTDEGVARVKTVPIIKKGLVDILAREGDKEVEFSVEISAYPKPKIKWYLDEMEITEKRNEYKKIEEANHCKLIVKKVTTELKGNYTCRVENECGSAEANAKLTVHSKPFFAKALQPKISVDEGAELTLQIECSGCPEPEVSWFKDGQEISTDAHIKITRDSHRSESYSMTLTLIKKSDSGDYEARATNCLGTATSKTYVEVFSKVIETSSDDVESVKQKEESEKPEISKEKEGEQENDTLTDLPNDKRQMSFRNWGGIKIQEIEENSFIEDKAELLSVNQGVVQECLDSENISEISMQKSQISRGVSIVSLSEDEQILSRNPSPTDFRVSKLEDQKSEKDKSEFEEGEEGEAEEEDGEEAKEWDKVALTSQKSVSNSPLENDTKESDFWTSPEKAVKENVPLERKGEILEMPPDEPIPTKSYHTQEKDKGDTFDQPNTQSVEHSIPAETRKSSIVTPEHEHENHSESDSAVDDDPVVKALLSRIQKQRSVLEEILIKEADTRKEDTMEKPKIKEFLKDQNCKGSDTAVFQCVVHAKPAPEVTWTFNGKEVKTQSSRIQSYESAKEIDDKTTEYTFTLKISEPRAEDEGQYSIKAQNKYGYDESSASLTIQIEDDKPQIKNLKNITAMISEEAIFEATVISKAPLKVKWLNEKKNKIESSDRITITEDLTKSTYKMVIKDVKSEDAGNYILVACNDAGETTSEVKLTISGESPSFTKLLEDSEIKNGVDTDFLVRCNGVPKPTVKWYKNKKEIFGDDKIIIKNQTEGQVSSTLSILNFGEEDVGEYEVTATNSLGTAKNTFNLKMYHAAPTFEKGLPKSAEVEEGEVLELKCKLTGSPIPTLKLLKDGKELIPEGRIKLAVQNDGLVKLSIENATPGDAGNYSLTAENSNGYTTNHCAVAVEPKNCKPKFTDSLKDMKGTIGQPIKLTAKLMSFPPPQIKWLKDGRPLKPGQAIVSYDESEGKIELTVNNLKPEDAGVYSVKVSNKLGETTQEAVVEAIEPSQKPKFVSTLSPLSAIEGSTAEFTVKADGNPKPTIQWYHNGTLLQPDGHKIIIKEQPDGAVSLLINECSPEDAGKYVAKAENGEGDADSCEAPLTVLGKRKLEKDEVAPSFVTPLNNLNVDEGAEIILSALIEGNPIPDITWEKDGKPLIMNDRILSTCDDKKVGLKVKDCKLSDAGVYTCHLANPLGTSKSRAKVEVKNIFKPPVFEEKFTNTRKELGDLLVLTTRISGNPKPEVEWYFNGQPIFDGDKYKITNTGDKYKLTLEHCEVEDSGLFRCSAFNRAGKAECVGRLDVDKKMEIKPSFEPPSFLKKINDCDVYKGMPSKFTACFTGSPKPEFEWYKGEEKLVPSNRLKMDCEDSGLIRLTILKTDLSDIGKYRLRIFNAHGEAECSANLLCDAPEERAKKTTRSKTEDKNKISSSVPSGLTDRPIISRMTDRSLTLSWKPYIPMTSQPPVTYTIEMCRLPEENWFTARKGIRSCACEIRNLEPFKDYKFRVIVENKYGFSEPSPFAITYRGKIIPDLPPFVPYLSPGTEFRPETSPYFPKDFDLERPPHDRYEQAPKFLRQEHDTQYGIKNQNSNLFWFVYGYPKPVMTYYFNDEPVEMGGRYESSYTRNGQATLFINRMLDRDVGIYEAVATNEHGTARQRVRLEIAEHPVFIQRPEESYVMLRNSCQLVARIVGVPYPEIKWYKDWQPLAPSSRIKMQLIAPDMVTLTINDVILKDEGLYSVSAKNVAGAISSSAMVHVEENEEKYNYSNYIGARNVKPRSQPYTNFYDLGDELGRGTQGVTYHAVERTTGQNYAAKFMHGNSSLKPFMLNELNIMNLLNHRKLIRLHDCFETNDLLVLIMELAGGGELLEWLIKQTYITETEIADFIRQILLGLEYMHSNRIAHLSLTLNDLLLSRLDGDELKICDFGLSRRIDESNLFALNYGMPEFVAPEVAKGEGVSYSADMWSLGIITYILLSGFSPFKGSTDRDTLTRVKEGRWEFNESYFSNISAEAKDFITKLLMYKPEDRLNVQNALRHPWFEKASSSSGNMPKIDMTNLRNYNSSLKSWYNNASCRKWYRREPFSNAFTHPSHMIYIPGHDYTPETEKSSTTTKKRNIPEGNALSREHGDYEVGNFKSESHYQYGPDTYLLQLRDVDLPCRLRHYMKVAADRQHSLSSNVQDKHIDWKTPVIRERRKFMDIADEEIDDEKRATFNHHGADEVSSPRRLKHEIGCRSDGYSEAEAMLECKRDGQLPFFREKPKNLAIIQNKSAELSCMVVGNPDPIVQWFKNDLVLAESSRIKMLSDQNKRFYLKFEPAIQSDVGAYKVVAKNKIGQTIARMRVVLATVPLSPDPPEVVDVSDTEVLLKWKQESDDVFTTIICFSLQYKAADSDVWTEIAKNIDHDFWLVKNLNPQTDYEFRLSSKNCVGWSASGIPSSAVKTKEAGVPKIIVPEYQRQIQSETEQRGDVGEQKCAEELDYSTEDAPLDWSLDSNVKEKYNFESELFRGEYSTVLKGIERSSNKHVAVKLFDVNANTEKSVAKEFENLRSLRHERIVTLLSAFRPAPNTAIFIMEQLQGSDILTYFASRQEYNEDMVVTALIQVLDGLQYLHWRGYCHLNIQPDNIVLSSAKKLEFKLVDFGSAQKVSKLGTITTGPRTDYSAPEILCGEPSFPQTDVWSLGTVAYILLSGVSPFRGETEKDTEQNIIFVRYRFEHLFKEITQEATRFIMQIFKRTPRKRPAVDECYESRWLLSNEFMIKKRQKACFPGHRLKAYNESYHAKISQKGGVTKESSTVCREETPEKC